jgi:hypothetical protein
LAALIFSLIEELSAVSDQLSARQLP